jgi:hypothetical protein
MLTLSDNFKLYTERDGFKIIFAVYIGSSNTGAVDYIAHYTVGALNYNGGPAIGVDVAAFSRSLNLLDGTARAGGMTVVLQSHPVLREVIDANQLIGKGLIVEFGTSDMVASDFAELFAGPIKSHAYIGTDDTVSILADSIDIGRVPGSFSSLFGRDARLGPVHPMFYGGSNATPTTTHFDETLVASQGFALEFIEDLLNNSNLPSRYVNAASFDQAALANDSIKHYKVHGISTVNADTRFARDIGAIETGRKVAWLSGGGLVVGEDGKLAFKFFNPSAATVGTIDGNQIIPDSFRVSASGDNLVGRVTVETCSALTSTEGERVYRASLTLEDRNFQDNFGHATSTTERIPWTYELKDDYFGAKGVLYEEHLAGNSSMVVAEWSPDQDMEPNPTVIEYRLGKGGFCGPFSAGNYASTTRPVYLLLQAYNGRLQEIVRAESAVFTPGPNRTTFATLTRIAGDTIFNSNRDPTTVVVYDITVAYLKAVALLDYFGAGSEKVTFQTNFSVGADGNSAYAYQVGDSIGIDDDRYVAFGDDGTPTGDKFVITSKAINGIDGTIDWMAQRLSDVSATLTYPGMNRFTDLDDPTIAAAPGMVRSRGSVAATIDADTTWGLASNFEEGTPHGTTSGTLTATLPRIRFWGGRSYRNIPTDSNTYTASRDTYVWLIYGDGDSPNIAWLQFDEQSNKTAPPSSPSGISGVKSEPFMMTRTDGTEVTATYDLRRRGIIAEKSARETEKTTKHRKTRTSNHVLEKLVTANSSGLDIDLVSCKCTIDGEIYTRTIDETVTLSATSAEWVYLTSTGSLGAQGAFVVVSGTIGDGEPSTRAYDRDYCLVGVIETDGSGIVEVRDWVSTVGGGSSAQGLAPSAGLLCPNSMLDDTDPDGNPVGWVLEATTTGTATAVSGDSADVVAGRHGIKFAIAANGDTATAYSQLFPLYPNMRWTGWLFYKTNANAGALTAGLRTYDADYAPLGFQSAWASSENISSATGTDGALDEAAWTGSASSPAVSELHDTARFVRVEVKYEANNENSYPQELVVSGALIQATPAP